MLGELAAKHIVKKKFISQMKPHLLPVFFPFLHKAFVNTKWFNHVSDVSLVFIKILLNCASFLFDSLGSREEEPTFGDVFGFSVRAFYMATVLVGAVLWFF